MSHTLSRLHHMTYLPNMLMLSEYIVKRQHHIVMFRVQPNMLVLYESSIKARDNVSLSRDTIIKQQKSRDAIIMLRCIGKCHDQVQ